MEQIRPEFNRSKKVEITDDVDFQVLSWNTQDYQNDDDDNGHPGQLSYHIYLSGVDKLGQSVTATVTGFTPYFYVLVPDKWRDLDAKLFFNEMKTKLGKSGYGLLRYELVKKKKLYPFLAERKFNFIKLLFTTDEAFCRCRYIFRPDIQKNRPIKISGVDNAKYYEAFETQIGSY